MFRTYAEGGWLAALISVLGRKKDQARIRDSIARARARTEADARDRTLAGEDEAAPKPRRWSRADRRARDATLRRRAIVAFTLTVAVSALYMWLDVTFPDLFG